MSTIIVTQQAKQTVNIVKEVNKTVEIYRKGEKGDQGIQGIKGDKGDKGDNSSECIVTHKTSKPEELL